MNDSERLAVATYFTLVSMMWQLADRQTMASDQKERTHIMDYSTPPFHWRVFVTEHEGKMWDEKILYTGFSFGVPEGSEIPKNPTSHTLVSTFGKVAFNTLSIRDAGPDMIGHIAKIYTDDFGLQTLWPVGVDITRPSRPHTDEQLLKIANSFYL